MTPHSMTKKIKNQVRYCLHMVLSGFVAGEMDGFHILLMSFSCSLVSFSYRHCCLCFCFRFHREKYKIKIKYNPNFTYIF